MNRITFLLFCGIALLLSVSCKKDEIRVNNPSDAQIYEIKNGILIFSSITSYRHLLENANGVEKKKFLAEVANRNDFVSMSENHSKLLSKNGRLSNSGNQDIDDDVEDLLSSDLLSTIVNSDGIVGIGSYLFNINLVTERCYALHNSFYTPSSSAAAYNDLYNENTNNNYIFNFSTEDDVLEILESYGYPVLTTDIDTTVVVANACGGAPKNKDKDTEYFPRYDVNTQDKLECKVLYQKAGVYFALLGKLKFKSGGQGDWQSRRDWYEWKFKPKCKDERSQNSATSYTTNAANKYKRYAYESTKGLSKYHVKFQWEILGHATTSNSYLKTRVYEIKSGY